jgi:glycosyltransferase involved in cell wall biosynthesis
MTLLQFNLAMDEDDPILGFAARWVAALARRFDRIHVITMRHGRTDLPRNVSVYSLGKERGHSRPRRLRLFYRHLRHVLRADRPDACFCHMIPEFALLAAPLLRPRGVPILTWYAHPALTWRLRLAHLVSARMVTSVAPAYPYRRDKLTVLGQGIDTDLFAPGGEPPDQPPLVLCAGRLSPVKGHPVLLQAAARLRQRGAPAFRVVILGGPATVRDERHARALHALAGDLGLQEVVQFEPPMPPRALPPWFRRATVHVNLTGAGFGDKVALEAMSCACPSLVANEGFRETLGVHAGALLFRHGDADDLAAKLLVQLQAPAAARERVGRELREQVLRRHSLAGLVERLTALLGALAGTAR